MAAELHNLVPRPRRAARRGAGMTLIELCVGMVITTLVLGALSALWSLGAPVPYPVQLHGTELMLEFIGTPEGQAAPRLAQVRPDRAQLADLFDQCVAAMMRLAEGGYAHGDLSPYNLLVHDGRLVMIDLPQIIDIAANPLGVEFLHRDCENVCTWFARRGLTTVEFDHLYGDLVATALGAAPR